MIDLAPQHLQTVKAILTSLVPKARVVVFGSRANGTAKKTSDLDLAIDNGKPLGLSLLGELKHAFSESNLPIRVDVVDLHAISKEFKMVIESGPLIRLF